MPQPPGPPAIVIENIDASVAQLNGTTIELKASGFPTTAASAILTSTFNDLSVNDPIAPANSLKRAFDLVIAGGVAGAATAGLVLVDTGNKVANTFTVDNINNNLSSYTTDQRVEGRIQIRANDVPPLDNNIILRGWSFYGLFMNNTAPTTSDADATPFAFTATTGAQATKPIMYCRTILTDITNPNSIGANRLQDNTLLTGGQKASCFVGALGTAFTGTAATAWLNTAASNTFKKKFNIATMGIRTDAKTVAEIGLPGTDKAAAFRDGIDATEMAALTAANPSAYLKLSVTIVP